MKDGFYLPTRGPLAEPDAIAAIVRGGESLGYATIVVGDHIVFPVFVESKYPYMIDGGFPGHGDALEQLSLMAFVAGITEHARLVTSVMILPHRNPLVTAGHGEGACNHRRAVEGTADDGRGSGLDGRAGANRRRSSSLPSNGRHRGDVRLSQSSGFEDTRSHASLHG